MTTLGRCNCCHNPPKSKVRVELENGYEIDVHDDGSFVQYTGEQ